jgi:hypothetical protein
LLYFIDIWYSLRYIFPRFGILYQEKSGNPGHRPDWAESAAQNVPMSALDESLQPLEISGRFAFLRNGMLDNDRQLVGNV